MIIKTIFQNIVWRRNGWIYFAGAACFYPAPAADKNEVSVRLRLPTAAFNIYTYPTLIPKP